MPCWYYDKKDLRNTPSFQIGIDPEIEARYRREGARFIINTGTKMGLRYDTMATGVVYFHRFYMFHSFKDFPRYVTACCCLFLAGKVEETPKKCKDIIKTARTLLNDNQFAQFGDDPKVNEEVMTLERILLQTIKFDLQVDHPYGYLLKYAKCLKGDKQKLQKMVQMAWTFVNDSLCTSLCLQWEPEIIAIALMYLAGKLSKFEVVDWSGRQPKHSRWWDMYVEDMSMELLEDICHQVLDLYSSNPGGIRADSPRSTSPSQIPGRPPMTQPAPIQAAQISPQIQAISTPVGKPRLCAPLNLPSAALSTRFPCGYPVAKTPPPPQQTAPAIPVQVPKTMHQESPVAPAKPIQVVEHKPTAVQSVSKPVHPVVQTVPVPTEPVVTHAPPQPPMPTTPVQLGQSANYTYPPPPPTENYTQFSSPVPPPPPYQPPPNYPPPSFPPVEPPSQTQPPPPFDSAPPPAQYTQPPPQHYPSNYDTQGYSNFPASSQQYFQNQSTYRAPPPPAPQYQENYNNPQPTQYAPSPAPTTTYPSTGGHPPGYPPQNPPFPPIPTAYAPRTAPPPPRPGHPQQHQAQPHPPPTPGGSIAPVRITGRSGRQSWAM